MNTIIYYFIPVLIFCLVAGVCGLYLKFVPEKPKKPQGPHIPLDSPCPACGHRDCELAYDSAAKIIKRRCKTCGCVVEQQPVYPDLFKKK